MPFFGGFRSNSAKRSKSATPASSSGISGGHLDSDNDRHPVKPKSNSFRRFFTSSTQPKKKKPAWDEDQHRRTSVARSETFAKKDDEQKNIRGTASVPRDKTGRKANGGVKTDVFEVLYQKPSSTRSSTQSEHTISQHGTGKPSSSPMRHPDFDGNTYRKPKQRMDKWRQQEVHDDEDKKVLVGQNYLVDREKWNENQFIKFDTQQRRQQNKTPAEEEELKYRTFSKRSFRPDFVDPTDNRSLVWFVDADAEGGEPGTKREYTGPPVRLFSRKPLTRTDTFRVDDDGQGITNRRSVNEPIRVEIKQPDSGVKVVPIGVAAPYNSHRNVTISTRSPSMTRSPHKSLQPSSYNPHEPIKIFIDRSNNNRDRVSPPPPYSSQTLVTNKSPQRTFSSSTIVIEGDDRDQNKHQHINRRTTVTQNEYSRRSDRKSGYEDVLNAVRAPNSYRQFNGSAALLNHNSNHHRNEVPLHKTQKPLFVSTVKVKPHRPAWR